MKSPTLLVGKVVDFVKDIGESPVSQLGEFVPLVGGDGHDELALRWLQLGHRVLDVSSSLPGIELLGSDCDFEGADDAGDE